MARSWQSLTKLACIVPCLGKSLEFAGPSIAVLLSEANLTQTFIAQIKQRQKESSVRIASRPRVDDCSGWFLCMSTKGYGIRHCGSNHDSGCFRLFGLVCLFFQETSKLHEQNETPE